MGLAHNNLTGTLPGAWGGCNSSGWRAPLGSAEATGRLDLSNNMLTGVSALADLQMSRF